jgi:hypothetical protein
MILIDAPLACKLRWGKGAWADRGRRPRVSAAAKLGVPPCPLGTRPETGRKPLLKPVEMARGKLARLRARGRARVAR